MVREGAKTITRDLYCTIGKGPSHVNVRLPTRFGNKIGRSLSPWWWNVDEPGCLGRIIVELTAIAQRVRATAGRRDALTTPSNLR